MRGFSLTEPWATLVAIGAKQWETRSWYTPYRGPLAIAAAKSYPLECRELCEQEPFYSVLEKADYRLVALTKRCRVPGASTRGHIIAVADLADCVRITVSNAPAEPEYSFGNYAPGRFMWRLENVRRLPEPIPCKGALGLWVVPTEIEARLKEQLR